MKDLDFLWFSDPPSLVLDAAKLQVALQDI